VVLMSGAALAKRRGTRPVNAGAVAWSAGAFVASGGGCNIRAGRRAIASGGGCDITQGRRGGGEGRAYREGSGMLVDGTAVEVDASSSATAMRGPMMNGAALPTSGRDLPGGGAV
jgi:hypothetical protein